MKDEVCILKPDGSLFWMVILGDYILLMLFGLACFGLILANWPMLTEPGDPFVQFLHEGRNHTYAWCAAIAVIGITVGYIGFQLFKFHRIKYILTKTGIVFGGGINYMEDLVAWQIINDVDLTRTIPEQLLGVGTVWVSTDGGIKKPLLYLKNYVQVREQLNNVIHANYAKVNRVTRV